MKKSTWIVIMVAVVMAVMASTAIAAGDDYYSARAKARICDKTGDTSCAIVNYLQAEAAAMAMDSDEGSDGAINWLENADWQRNNAGYCLIIKYQESADKALLTEALKVFNLRPVTSQGPKEKIKKNIIYCTEQLK